MQITRRTILSANIPATCRFAIIADLHNERTDALWKILRREKPDAILIPGDLMEPLTGPYDDENTPTFQFLTMLASCYPVFYAFGNHELGACHSGSSRLWNGAPGQSRCLTAQNLRRLRESGATLLDDTCTFWSGICIGGLSSGLRNEGRLPNLAFVRSFAGKPGFRLLLCHHPEYYEPYLRDTSIDLIVSGHAHGGQWRFFGRGVFAPGQGLFPKYTGGLHDGRFLISRGLSNNTAYPRLFNPRELIILTLKPTNGGF